MRTNEMIERMVMNELKGLCLTCRHTKNCVYHKSTAKQVIQCELFDCDLDSHNNDHVLRGLCTNCDHALACTLPGKQTGVWHCNEFK
jgi:hypothetical protein